MCVDVWVCVYVRVWRCMLVRWKRKPLKFTTLRYCVEDVWFWAQRSKVRAEGPTFRNFGTNCHPANKNKSDYCLFTKITFIMLNCDVSQKFRDIYVMKDIRRNYNLNFWGVKQQYYEIEIIHRYNVHILLLVKSRCAFTPPLSAYILVYNKNVVFYIILISISLFYTLYLSHSCCLVAICQPLLYGYGCGVLWSFRTLNSRNASDIQHNPLISDYRKFSRPNA